MNEEEGSSEDLLVRYSVMYEDWSTETQAVFVQQI